MADYYEILGVEKNASKDEIKSAFRKMARQWHPDINKAPEAEAKFKELGKAYQPTMKANGEYVTALADGVETSIEFTVNGAAAAKTVTAFVITYGENNKMLSATPVTKTVAANTPETFTLTVTKAAGVTTKVIVMDANTYAPLYDVIQ